MGSGPRVVRRPVPPEEREPGADYADRFVLHLDEPDGRTAEQWLRAGLDGAPRPVRWTVLVAHRHVLRFDLGPLDSPDHVLGWRLARRDPDLARMEARSPLLDAVIEARRLGPTSAALTTSLVHRHPVARAVWWAVGPLHRRIAPYLLARAARHP